MNQKKLAVIDNTEDDEEATEDVVLVEDMVDVMVLEGDVTTVAK